MDKRVKELEVLTTQGQSGSLVRGSQFVVRYKDEALQRPNLAVSLTMPPRPEGWSSNEIPPVFAMNLPEGFLLHRVFERYQKVLDTTDEMNLLAVTSTPAAGRVWTQARATRPRKPGEPIALRSILSHRGTEDLFDELLESYGIASLSGVQPKVIVPEAGQSFDETRNVYERSSARSPNLIVKAAGADYPGLAENEFICMSIARHAGLETPDFWLSDDKQIFVIRRFDVGPDGFLGFEDMACLTGRHPRKKYDGSYSIVARVISDFTAPSHRASSLEAFFKLVVLNCVIRNGDAHMKNFGVLYSDPSKASSDARLAPAYDLVNTTMYVPKDRLALSLNGDRAWPDRRTLDRFGTEACELTNPSRIIEEIVDNVSDYSYADSKSEVWASIRRQVDMGLGAIKTSPKIRRRVVVT